MKSTLTTMLVLLTFISYSQESVKPVLKNRFKISPLRLFSEDFKFGYERMLTNKFGVQFETSMNYGRSNVGSPENGISISPEIRYYPFKFPGGNIYTGINYSFDKYTYNMNGYVQSLTSNRIGVGAGVQFNVLKRFLIETGVNYGNRWTSTNMNTTHDQKENIAYSNLNNGGNFKMNFGVGYIF